MDQHIDCTLAIMEGASGKRLCPWWLQGGHLLIDGKKMSKSRGNVTTLYDLLARGFRPRHIRFFLLYGPYREPLDPCASTLDACAGRLDRIRHLARCLFAAGGGRASEPHDPEPSAGLHADFTERMDEDLDYAGAFDALGDHLMRASEAIASGSLKAGQRERLIAGIWRMDSVLGEFGGDPADIDP